MQQRGDTGLSPPRGHLIKILLKRAEDDVTVAVDQRRDGRHNRVETRFRPILQGREQQLAGWFQHFANRQTQTGLLISTVIPVEHTNLDRFIDSAERFAHRLLNAGLGVITRAGAVGITG